MLKKNVRYNKRYWIRKKEKKCYMKKKCIFFNKNLYLITFHNYLFLSFYKNYYRNCYKIIYKYFSHPVIIIEEKIKIYLKIIIILIFQYNINYFFFYLSPL